MGRVSLGISALLKFDLKAAILLPFELTRWGMKAAGQ